MNENKYDSISFNVHAGDNEQQKIIENPDILPLDQQESIRFGEDKNIGHV